MVAFMLSGTISLSPMTWMCIFFSATSGSSASSFSVLSISSRRKFTSASSLLKFSVENAYTVRFLTPSLRHQLSTSRILSLPAMCPSLVSRPSSLA